jgi:hypothetical protein
MDEPSQPLPPSTSDSKQPRLDKETSRISDKLWLRLPLFSLRIYDLVLTRTRKRGDAGMKYLFLFTWLILLSSDLSANSIRCGNKVVKTGDSGNQLIKKCGNPARKFSGKAFATENGRSSSVTVSNWVFERDGKKDMIVSVRNGTVIKIKAE